MGRTDPRWQSIKAMDILRKNRDDRSNREGCAGDPFVEVTILRMEVRTLRHFGKTFQRPCLILSCGHKTNVSSTAGMKMGGPYRCTKCAQPTT